MIFLGHNVCSMIYLLFNVFIQKKTNTVDMLQDL